MGCSGIERQRLSFPQKRKAGMTLLLFGSLRLCAFAGNFF